MKTSTRLLKVVAFFFSVLILFQGCTVYKSANVSLEEALKADTKVRLKTKDHQTLKFKNVEVENEIYYGLINFRNTWVKTQINEDNIEKLQVKDKTASTIITIGIPVLILGYLALDLISGPSLHYRIP